MPYDFYRSCFPRILAVPSLRAKTNHTSESRGWLHTSLLHHISDGRGVDTDCRRLAPSPLPGVSVLRVTRAGSKACITPVSAAFSSERDVARQAP